MKIASAIMCFKRPDYLEQTIKSLENADESSEVDWFVFQDGAENKISGEVYATQSELDAVADVINTSTLPIKEFTQQDSNISPSQQRYLILSLLNEYDLVYVFEDDLIVSK
jgi:heptaprenylglyceryl phosphate synthase